tara:strand:- start:466 stop:933 length:468 start_codon:yes stop_codon:yes gene_type:complete
MSKIIVTNINDVSDNASLITQSGGIKTDKLTGVSTDGSILVTSEGSSTTTSLQQGLAKAWLKFNGVSNAVTDSFNITSASDIGSGIVTHSFVNNMNNDTYVLAGMGGYSDFVQFNTARTNATPSSTSVTTLLNANYNFTRIDTANMNSVEFGDLA